MGAAHAGDDPPLSAAGQKQLEGGMVLRPYFAAYFLGRDLRLCNAECIGIGGPRVFHLTGTRPPPAGGPQFFAAASARPCCAANQLITSGRRT